MTTESFFTNQNLLVLATTGNADEASRIAHALVNERLAACVNIVPAVQSVYRWKEKVESETEILLLIKTTSERFPALRDRIIELHSYETPEVIAVPISIGSDKYLSWLHDQID